MNPANKSNPPLSKNNFLGQYTFIEQLKKQPFIEELWLFGSRARQDHNERSDIDIAVICPSATEADWLKVMSIVEQADTLLKIDCLKFDQDTISKELYNNVLKDKKVIYTKEMQWTDSFYSLGNAINRLKEVLEHSEIDKNDYMRDASIQRFEFTIEMFWRVLKKILSYEKVESTTPRDTLSKSFQYRLIDHENEWLAMLDDRNNMSHAYKEEQAKLIFGRIKTYLPIFQSTYDTLKVKYGLERF